MPTFETRFHGLMSVEESAILTVDYEILGFPDEKEFVLLPHRADSPFLYLQSVHSPDLAFVTIDPLLRVADYQVPSSDIAKELGQASDWAVLCLCTMGNGQPPSMNLRSPLVFNRHSRRGGQFVLSVPYPVQYPLFADEADKTNPEEPSHAGTQPQN
jgi:flagellar assembly factor FliW